MKYWTRQALSNKLKEISDRLNVIRHELDMGNPDFSTCDEVLKSIWRDVGTILKTRKEEGWPK